MSEAFTEEGQQEEVGGDVAEGPEDGHVRVLLLVNVVLQPVEEVPERTQPVGGKVEDGESEDDGEDVRSASVTRAWQRCRLRGRGTRGRISESDVR